MGYKINKITQTYSAAGAAASGAAASHDAALGSSSCDNGTATTTG